MFTETDFTKKLNPYASIRILPKKISTLELACRFLSQNSRFLFAIYKRWTKDLTVWRNFSTKILKSIGRSGFSSGFLFALIPFLKQHH
jgi:hypothetical protein